MEKAMEDVLMPKDGDVLLLVSITKSVKSGERGSLYEATRKWWRLRPEMVQKVTHVLGVDGGKVCVVYDDAVWKVTDNGQYAGRLEFTSAHEDGVESEYIGKRFRLHGPTAKLSKDKRL